MKVDVETSLGEFIERAKKVGESVEVFEKYVSVFDVMLEWKWLFFCVVMGLSE